MDLQRQESVHSQISQTSKTNQSILSSNTLNNMNMNKLDRKLLDSQIKVLNNNWTDLISIKDQKQRDS
jgi:hypothetical protein